MIEEVLVKLLDVIGEVTGFTRLLFFFISARSLAKVSCRGGRTPAHMAVLCIAPCKALGKTKLQGCAHL